MACHPQGIARLVSSFRWKRDIYLLLEYAARGDLHSHIRRMGSLAPANAQFIFAEIAAGLAAVHASGFAFGDLKPENILLTASGHAKLTDFGAARPLPGHAGAMAALATSRHVITELRDGDWRARRDKEEAEGATAAVASVAAEASDGAPGGDGGTAEGGLAHEAEAEDDEMGDGRLEGTAAYLAPELVAGGRPSIASDGWAFGCTLYQALCGRPPLWAENQAEVMRRIIRFDGVDDETYPDKVPPLARELIGSLLKRAPAERISSGGMAAVRSHAFFDGANGDALYGQTPPPLAGGAAAPQPNARWARRQNSMMWSPLPQRYAFGEDDGSALDPLPETEGEAAGSFTRKLAAAREGELDPSPLPPPRPPAPVPVARMPPVAPPGEQMDCA